jgi:hypothetical protein
VEDRGLFQHQSIACESPPARANIRGKERCTFAPAAWASGADIARAKMRVGALVERRARGGQDKSEDSRIVLTPWTDEHFRAVFGYPFLSGYPAQRNPLVVKEN